MVPETIQTEVVVEVKLTARLELAVAASVSGVPAVCVPGLAKVMVCVAWVTVTADDVPVAEFYVEELLASGV